eukprot:TRINITY_DN3946_c0_g1_i3.p1 TRINITY_DN3946_c0_g1~~TRINITY_DN3946_c0_g1_i3.p1  ORF type:complete len:617 (+),score=134.66 TRINITY_DN3946_c0_g1_i3:39-1889(+)
MHYNRPMYNPFQSNSFDGSDPSSPATDRELINTSVCFKVKANTVMGEVVCLIGNIPSLGAWDWRKSLPMNTGKGTYPEWSISVDLPPGTSLEYKYIVKRASQVMAWETLLNPRKLTVHPHCRMNVTDGEFNDDGFHSEYVDKGWLNEDQVQLRLFVGTPQGESQFKNISLASKVPYTVVVASSSPSTFDKETFTNVATLQPDNSFVFITNSASELKIAFSFSDMAHQHLFGRSFITPENLKTDQGILSLPIVGTGLDVIGQMEVMYLVARPFLHAHNDSKAMHHRLPFWMGHRGLGARENMSTLGKQVLTENSLVSFLTAAKMGADYVEFDVQLTKDDIPVIAHDQEIWIKTDDRNGDEVRLKIPVNKVTYNKIQKLIPMVSKEDQNMTAIQRLKQTIHTRKFQEAKDKTTSKFVNKLQVTSHWGKLSGFPTLQELLHMVPIEVGFNIEIKYPDTIQEEIYYSQKQRNDYLDKILEVLFDHIGERLVIISSFDPDICLLLALKQIKYPILFLTCGGTIITSDHRRNSVDAAIQFAGTCHLAGIVSDAAPILDDLSYINKAHEAGLLLLTYGEKNMMEENVRIQKKAGVDAVIGDSIVHIKKKNLAHQSEILQNLPR